MSEPETDTTPQEDAKAHHKVLSLAVFPGAGQYVQGRKAVAIPIMALFSIAVVGLLYFLIAPTVQDALRLIRIHDYYTPLTFRYQPAIPWAIASLVIYAVNAWDICRS